MNFNLTFIPDEPYHQEAYNEIVSTLKYKKYEPFFATLMVILALGCISMTQIEYQASFQLFLV